VPLEFFIDIILPAAIWLAGILFPRINDDARSKSHQIYHWMDFRGISYVEFLPEFVDTFSFEIGHKNTLFIYVTDIYI